MKLKSSAKNIFVFFFLMGFSFSIKAQVVEDTSLLKHADPRFLGSHDPCFLPPQDTVFVKSADTVLRIKNFSPYFTLHVDSTLDYHFAINRDPEQYHWYLKNSPVGLR